MITIETNPKYKKIDKFSALELGAEINVSHIVTMHYFKYSKEFHFGGERHRFWEIAYVDQGEVGVAVERNCMRICQGEAIFHKPNEYHNIWSNNRFCNVIILSFVCDSPAMSFFEKKIITFSEEHRMLLAKILSFGEVYFEDPFDNVDQIKIDVKPNTLFGCAQIIKAYIEILLVMLIQNDSALAPVRKSNVMMKQQGENAVVKEIIQMLNGQIYGNISIGDILSKLCFSKSYVTGLFKKHTGFSIMEYYTNLKIEEAKKLISERQYSLTEISEKLAFGSVQYFSSLFKKKTNMTPSEYSKTVQAISII